MVRMQHVVGACAVTHDESCLITCSPLKQRTALYDRAAKCWSAGPNRQRKFPPVILASYDIVVGLLLTFLHRQPPKDGAMAAV